MVIQTPRIQCTKIFVQLCGRLGLAALRAARVDFCAQGLQKLEFHSTFHEPDYKMAPKYPLGHIFFPLFLKKIFPEFTILEFVYNVEPYEHANI